MGLQSTKASIVAILSPAGDHVVPIQHGKQAGNFFRIVLKIGVDGGDHFAAGGFESSLEGSALAAVFGHAKDAQPGIFLHAFFEQLRRQIGRSEERRVGKECRARWSWYY